MENIKHRYIPSTSCWVFLYTNSIQIGGELMKKIVTVALACAGAILVGAILVADRKEE